MSRKILSWLDKRRKLNTFQLVRKHLELTVDTVEELLKATKFKIVQDDDAAQSRIDLISQYEREADSLRRHISLEVSKSELPPSERGDLLRLVRIVDWIADWSLESARILTSTSLHKLPSELADIIIQMIEKVKECVHAVLKCIDKLGEDLESALKLADQVELFEEDVDELYQKARSYYPSLNYKVINPGEALLISQFIDAVEYIADWCENTIDQVRVVAIGEY